MSNSLKHFGMQIAYQDIKAKGDQLEPLAQAVEWESFRKHFPKAKSTGRPPYDSIMMFKILVLQGFYGLNNDQVEYQIKDRISFQRFLGFPKEIPDAVTIWRFREDLSSDLIDNLWIGLQEQLNKKGIKSSKGVIQDASFIEADPGRTNSSDKDRGQAKGRRNKDGRWTKKNSKSYFGFKLHAKVDESFGIIRKFELTSANVHNSKIDLANPDEIIFRDKGYFGGVTCAIGNGTMDRNVRGHKMSWRQKHRNKRITKRRAKGERPFAVIKRVMNGGHTTLTTLPRVLAQTFVVCFTFNLMQIR